MNRCRNNLKNATPVLVLFLLFGPVMLAVAAGQGEEGTEGSAVALKLGHTLAVGHPYHIAMERLAELAHERSGGSLTVQIFPSGQMGNARTILESVSLGILDMAFSGSSHVGWYNPRMSIFQTPYIAESVDEMLEVAASDIVAEEIEKTAMESNIRVLTYAHGGTRHITTSNNPIYSPEDMEGLKLRTPEVPMTLEFMRMVGASPTPMALSEVYLALQQGVVDGQENPVTTIYWQRFHEVQGYLNLTGHIILLQAVVIAENVWNALSEDHRDVLLAATAESADYLRELIEASDAEIIESMEGAGVTVIEPDVQAFRAAARGITDKFADDWGEGFADSLFN